MSSRITWVSAASQGLSSIYQCHVCELLKKKLNWLSQSFSILLTCQSKFQFVGVLPNFKSQIQICWLFSVLKVFLYFQSFGMLRVTFSGPFLILNYAQFESLSMMWLTISISLPHLNFHLYCQILIYFNASSSYLLLLKILLYISLNK